MDYLTILSTRSLILFPSPSSLPSTLASHRPLPVSPLSSPTTPTATLPPPEPVAMPLGSLLSADTHCAWFLLHHVLSSTQPFGWTPAGTDKETTAEAEVMVWREIDRAKMFARGLGEVFGTLEMGEKMGEEALWELAGKYGLGIKSEHQGESGEGEGEAGQVARMDKLSIKESRSKNGGNATSSSTTSKQQTSVTHRTSLVLA